MVRISVELINDSYQYINAVNQREISLRNLQIPSIENLGVTRDQFDVIDLTDNNIRKLDNLPLLKRLDTLLLHNNRIQYIDRRISEQLPGLRTLALTNNNITELGDIDSLAKCKKLEYLSLIGNPVTRKPRYRQYVIYKLKDVRVLDFMRIKKAERDAARQLFKGATGEKLRKEIVKQSYHPTEETEAERIAQIKRREDQQKIKELIKGAKSLADIEHVQAVLHSGKIPSSLDGAKKQVAKSSAAGMGLEEEEETDEEDTPGQDQMEVDSVGTHVNGTGVADEPVAINGSK